MSSNQIQAQMFEAAAELGYIADPGSGGTIKIDGRSGGMMVTTGSGTRTLPNTTKGGIWMMVVPSDTGTVTLVDGSGATVVVIVGTSGTSGAFLFGTDANSWAASYLGQSSAGPAGNLALTDAAGLTTKTTVEAAITEIYQSLYINLPLTGFIKADGTVLTVFADNAASNPGFTPIASGKGPAIRWNNNATQVGICTQFQVPGRMRANDVGTLKLLVSKSGATVGDATTFGVNLCFVEQSALYDAETSFTGTTNALSGALTAKTTSLLSLALTSFTALDISGTQYSGLLSIKPTDGTLGTDDLFLHAAWIEF